MKPIAESFGDVTLPPTDPRYVDGAPGSRVPSVSGLSQDTARERLQDAGFQVADQATPVNSAASGRHRGRHLARRSDRARLDRHHPDQQRHPAAATAAAAAGRAAATAGPRRPAAGGLNRRRDSRAAADHDSAAGSAPPPPPP